MTRMIWLLSLSLIAFLILGGCAGEPAEPESASLTPTASAAQLGDNPYDFEEALRQTEGYSVSVEIVKFATGKKVSLNRDDSRYVEFIQLFNFSVTGRFFIENDKTTAAGRAITYVWGDILTFTLRDGSKVWYNCSGEYIWYDSMETIIQCSFSEDFHLFVEEILNHPSDYSSLSGVTLQPEKGEFLYYNSQFSAGTILGSVNARTGILDEDSVDIQNQGKIIKKGEPCLIVSGQIESQLNQDKYMTMVARGYDADGQEVAHVLDHGPIQGMISIFLPAKGFGGFIIHLNAAPEVVRINLIPSPELYDIPPP
jgi:hypothetical protein